MAKLTLSVNDRIVRRAKQYAKLRGVSISSMVETYLDAVAQPKLTDRATPILQSLRGIIKNADVSDYRKHLESKYR
jgi:hypothetical protein